MPEDPLSVTPLTDGPLPRTTAVLRGGVTQPDHRLWLTAAQRVLRSGRVETADGLAFDLDLPGALRLSPGDALVLSDGRRIAVEAAPEPVLRLAGDLPRLAWALGNRHIACRFAADVLVVADRPGLADQLASLGAAVEPATEPFEPDGPEAPDPFHGEMADLPPEGRVARASPVQWLQRNPGTAPAFAHELPDHGPFDAEP